MAERTEFYLMRVDEPDKLHKINCGESSIGRDVNAFITCTSAYVSRRHLILSRKLRSSEIYVKDLKTANGTYINNLKIIPEKYYPFYENDVITLGSKNDIPAAELYQFKLIKKIVRLSDNWENNNIIVIDDDDEDVIELDNVSNLVVENDPNPGISKASNTESHLILESKVSSDGNSRINKSSEDKNNSTLDAAVCEQSPHSHTTNTHSRTCSISDSGVNNSLDTKSNHNSDSKTDGTPGQPCENSEPLVDNVFNQMEQIFMSQSDIDEHIDLGTTSSPNKGPSNSVVQQNIICEEKTSSNGTPSAASSSSNPPANPVVTEQTDVALKNKPVNPRDRSNSTTRSKDDSKVTKERPKSGMMSPKEIDNNGSSSNQKATKSDSTSKDRRKSVTNTILSKVRDRSDSSLSKSSKDGSDDSKSKERPKLETPSTSSLCYPPTAPVVILERMDHIYVKESLKRKISRTSIESREESAKYLRLESSQIFLNGHCSSSPGYSHGEEKKRTKGNSKSEKSKYDKKANNTSSSTSKSKHERHRVNETSKVQHSSSTNAKETSIVHSSTNVNETSKVQHNSSTINVNETSKDTDRRKNSNTSYNKDIALEDCSLTVNNEVTDEASKSSKDEKNKTNVESKSKAKSGSKNDSLKARLKSIVHIIKEKSIDKCNTTSKTRPKSVIKIVNEVSTSADTRNTREKGRSKSNPAVKERSEDKAKTTVEEGHKCKNEKNVVHVKEGSKSKSAEISILKEGSTSVKLKSSSTRDRSKSLLNSTTRSKDDSKVTKERTKSGMMSPKEIDNNASSSNQKATKSDSASKDRRKSVTNTIASKVRDRSDSSLSKSSKEERDDSKSKERPKLGMMSPKAIDNNTPLNQKVTENENTPKDRRKSVTNSVVSKVRDRSDSSLSKSSKDGSDDSKSKERPKSTSSKSTAVRKRSESLLISKEHISNNEKMEETTSTLRNYNLSTPSCSSSSKSLENKREVSVSTLQMQTRSSVRTKHSSSTPISDLVTGTAGQNKRPNCTVPHSKDPRKAADVSCSTCKTDSDPGLGRIPRRQSTSTVNSNDEFKIRRRSIFEDLYESPKSPQAPTPAPIVAPVRRKSVSFILDDNNPKIPERRASVVGIKSILKPSKRTNTLDIPDWLMCFLKIVIRWNPKWVEEHFKMKKDKNDFTFPPIFHNKKTTPPIFTYLFKDFEQYSITLTNLIIMEVWELVYNMCIEKKILTSNDVITMKISGQPVLPCDGSNITKISCKCVTTPKITELLSKKTLSNGTMLIVKFPGVLKAEYFGLFNECDNKSLRFGSKETIFSFFTKVDLNTQWHKKLCDGVEVTLKIVASVRNEMMLVKAIHGVEPLELCNIIISPKETHFTKFKSSIPLQWRHELNPSQKRAVQQCICAISSHIACIQMIHGPPGTGKSRVIAALVLEYYQRNVKNRSNRGKVLICSQTNIAVDDIIKRLLDEKRKHKAEKLFKMVRVGRFENMQPWAQEISSTSVAQKFLHTPEMQAQIEILSQQVEKYKSKADVEGPQGAYCKMKMITYKKKLDELFVSAGDGSASLHKEELEVIKNADVIVTTLQGCSASKMQVLNNKIAFCVIDEAAKAVEPEVLIPLGLGVECLVMVGDNQQLTGFTHSQYAKQKGFNESLFSRILHSMSSWKDSPLLSLDVQYRMSPDIASFPNQAFYEGSLKNGMKYPPLPRLLPEYRVVHIPGSDCGQGESGANFNEAKVVSRLAVAMKHVCVTEKTNFTICVLTPYSGHRDALQTQLKILSCTDIDVYTVDGFQGQERDVVLISLARSAGTGFLVDPGRMSVLLTRAKRSCIVCCNPDFVKGQPLWESFLIDAEKRKMERKLPKNIGRGMFRNTPKDLETLLHYIV